MLLIVFGNCLITYLFEKVIIYYISEWNQERLERKRLASINEVVKQGRTDLDNYFILKQQKAGDRLNTENAGQNGVGTSRMVAHDDEVAPGELDEKSRVGNINNTKSNKP